MNIVIDTSFALTTLPDELAASIQGSFSLYMASTSIAELEAKQGHTTLGYAARQWLRLIDRTGEIDVDVLGCDLGDGMFFVTSLSTEQRNNEVANIGLKDADVNTLALAEALTHNKEDECVELATRSQTMRIAAKFAQVAISPLSRSRIATSEYADWDGWETISISDEAYALLQMDSPGETIAHKLIDDEALNHIVHGAVQLVNERGNLLEQILLVDGKVVPIRDNPKRIVTPRSLEQRIACAYLDADVKTVPVVSVSGPAGTGKTLLALSSAIEQGKNPSEGYERIIVFRSMYTMGNGQDLGFLPGTVEEKMKPWEGPVVNALNVMSNGQSKFVEEAMKKIEVLPISYLRGYSIPNAFVIIEEAQNFNALELAHILSRMGEGTKCVLLFDPNQVDNRYLESGSHADCWKIVSMFKRHKPELFAHITLKKSERSNVAEFAADMIHTYLH